MAQHNLESAITKTDTTNQISTSLIPFIDSSGNQFISTDKKATTLFLIIKSNKFINTIIPAKTVTQQEKKQQNKTIEFYLIVLACLFLGVIRMGYKNYFSNIIRVFFNTSLRQSQLTDQLLLSQLPSLLMNILFFIVSSLYVFFILKKAEILWVSPITTWLYCFSIIGMIYLIKYLFLRLFSWLTNFKKEINVYIFIVFLVNKMLAILLLPFIFIIAFSDSQLKSLFIFISFILIGLMIILRFLKAYDYIKNQLRLSRFHFAIYVFAMEIIPIILIYKTGLNILNKSL
jgi:hypothetical protein